MRAALNRLFLTDVLPFDVLLIVSPPACGAKSVHVVLDVVVAELTDLSRTYHQLSPLLPSL